MSYHNVKHFKLYLKDFIQKLFLVFMFDSIAFLVRIEAGTQLRCAGYSEVN